MKIEIPKNIQRYIKENDGVNLAININSAAGDYGYAHVIWITYVISKLTRTCNRCGYDVIWNPDDSESKCQRHTYDAYRYDDVFIYSEKDNDKSLEEAFEEWESQNRNPYKPIKRMTFGRVSWK